MINSDNIGTHPAVIPKQKEEKYEVYKTIETVVDEKYEVYTSKPTVEAETYEVYRTEPGKEEEKYEVYRNQPGFKSDTYEVYRNKPGFKTEKFEVYCKNELTPNEILNKQMHRQIFDEDNVKEVMSRYRFEPYNIEKETIAMNGVVEIGSKDDDGSSPKLVLVTIATGSEEIELSSIVDILRRAGATVTVAKVDRDEADPKSKMCVMSRGLKVEADTLFDKKLLKGDKFDAIVMPGGGPGSQAFSDSTLLVKTLKKYLANPSKLVACICATPAVVLNKHGLLAGYEKVTCFPSFGDQMDPKQYVADETVVRSRNLITS